MPKQESVVLTPEQRRAVDKLVQEKRKADPFTKRAQVLRMLIDRGLAALQVSTTG